MTPLDSTNLLGASKLTLFSVLVKILGSRAKSREDSICSSFKMLSMTFLAFARV